MNRTVAIVGRPNVGKSTLFNRLVGDRKAIIDDISGVTRDRIYGDFEWNGLKLDVIDTGGFVQHTKDVFETAIKDQVHIAIEEARVILFVVDVTTGITALDDEVAKILRRSGKNPIIVVNKVDNHNRLNSVSEFYSLGFEEMYPVSSISGSGSGELLDAVVERFPKKEIEEFKRLEEEDENKIPKIAIIGQPNVGKSSLVNALMGEERNIVTDIAGTTRDTIHSHYNKYDKEFIIIDTAGIRKKNKVHEDLEFYSVIRAIKAIDEANIILLLIDAKAGIEAQDMALFKIVQRKRKAVAIIVNKWDTVAKETNTMIEYEKRLKIKLAPFSNVPILFTSVIEKQRIFNILNMIDEIQESLQMKISTSELNDYILPIINSYPPPSHRGTPIRVKYVTQLKTTNPTFAFFCNYAKHVPRNYVHFLKNKILEKYDFKGVMVTVLMKDK